MKERILLTPGANGFAEDKEEARRIRLQKILPALERKAHVVLDFRDVRYATQSYIHALVGEALQKYGESVLQKLEFKRCSAALRSVIELVVDYSLGGFPDEKPSGVHGVKKKRRAY
jgi:hypothetical protein